MKTTKELKVFAEQLKEVQDAIKEIGELGAMCSRDEITGFEFYKDEVIVGTYNQDTGNDSFRITTKELLTKLKEITKREDGTKNSK